MIRCCTVLLGVFFSCWGCGSGLNTTSVQGTVTHNGQPLPGVRVTFFPDVEFDTSGPRSSGITDANGLYQLHTDGGHEGAVQGKYRICLLDLQFLEAWSKQATKRKSRSVASNSAQSLDSETVSVSRRIPESYERADKTPLRAEVRSGPQKIDFDIP